MSPIPIPIPIPIPGTGTGRPAWASAAFASASGPTPSQGSPPLRDRLGRRHSASLSYVRVQADLPNALWAGAQNRVRTRRT